MENGGGRLPRRFEGSGYSSLLQFQLGQTHPPRHLFGPGSRLCGSGSFIGANRGRLRGQKSQQINRPGAVAAQAQIGAIDEKPGHLHLPLLQIDGQPGHGQFPHLEKSLLGVVAKQCQGLETGLSVFHKDGDIIFFFSQFQTSGETQKALAEGGGNAALGDIRLKIGQ